MMESLPDHLPGLIQGLCAPGVLDDQGHVELVETHISYVLLTDDYAYKIKKPVNLGFVDFSSLQKREYFCNEELRLNRRFSGDLYIAVVKVTGSEQTPVINGEGECLEYAVKMQRFSRNQELGLLLRQQLVANEKFWTFSVDLAHFHEMAEVADKHSRFATLDALKQSEMENFTHVSRNLNSPELLKLKF